MEAFDFTSVAFVLKRIFTLGKNQSGTKNLRLAFLTSNESIHEATRFYTSAKLLWHAYKSVALLIDVGQKSRRLNFQI